jgi:prolyl-tRNA synthetase
MRASQFYISTSKETPAEAEIASHQLMLRCGMIKRLGSGLYTWLPLGLRVLRKIENIIREEMNRAGALELLMPAIQPAELWQETGRWQTFGGQLLTMKDSNQRDYCFGPTHEEVITDIMRQTLHSYKQLPITMYQIQTKFRDEIRPRFGVMRAREFMMKDAYSFHLTTESLQVTYDVMKAAYQKTFTRMGLAFRAVEADTGAIGGAVSHEFQVLADAGEDLIFYSDQSDYAANIEQACAAFPPTATETIENPQIKYYFVEGSDQPVVTLILREEDTLNEIKAIKHPWVKKPLRLLEHNPHKETTPVIVDHCAAALTTFGYAEETRYDLRNVIDGDPSPDGKGLLRSCRGIEVGHIFQLGDKYARAMQAEVQTPDGQRETLLMGCYGIGVSRIVAATIEQNHDEAGIRWPTSIAPFQCVIIPIGSDRNPNVLAAAEKLYLACLKSGVDALLDDRAERPGVLFADHDLIGIPHRFIVSERNLAQNKVEYKARTGKESQPWLMNEAVNKLASLCAIL